MVYRWMHPKLKNSECANRIFLKFQVGTCTDRLLHDHKPHLETIRSTSHKFYNINKRLKNKCDQDISYSHVIIDQDGHSLPATLWSLGGHGQ